MRFSIIIPVYNVEKYIRKCLESVEKQTFEDYEVIIVNDGTKDNSQRIIDEFVKRNPEKFKSFMKENGGLSDARNYGVAHAKGEYIFFLDADDYIDIDLLEKVNANIENNQTLELIRIQIHTVTENNVTIEKENLQEKCLSGEELFIELRSKRICIEPAWAYIIKKSYWDDNGFVFPKGKVHEDFATMLMVVLKAQKAFIAQDVYYHYVIRENSIMTNQSYENELKKSKDKLEHYDLIVEQLYKNKEISRKAKNTCLEYIATAVCMEIKKLKENDKKEYREKLKSRKVLKNIKCNSLRNTLRKIAFIFIVNI